MISVDTERVKKSGQDIIKLSSELNKMIDNIYSRIYNMPVLTGEWVGDSAEYFAKCANNVDKKEAILLSKSLYKFGECLVESAEKYETKIRENV